MTENTYEPASGAQRKRLIPSLEKYLAWERMHGASQTQPADGSRHVVELAIVELQRLTAENERKDAVISDLRAKLDKQRTEIAQMRSVIVHVYNTGYHAGHEDTVEGGFTDVLPCDMDTYHEDIVSELLTDLMASTTGENDD